MQKRDKLWKNDHETYFTEQRTLKNSSATEVNSHTYTRLDVLTTDRVKDDDVQCRQTSLHTTECVYMKSLRDGGKK